MEELRADLPLRLEMDAVSRVLGSLDLVMPVCLDVGFANPASSLLLRRHAGYWVAAAWDEEHRRRAAEVLREEVLATGADGELPYEDKQFDVVVIGRGRLKGSRAADDFLVRECHRVLKPQGYLILGADYRKPAGLAGLFGRDRGGSPRDGYSESGLFDLLKSGFDVLGVKTYGRFWVQVVRRLLDRPGRSRALVGSMYGLACRLDAPLFFTKGYQVIVHGRRKGWRPRQAPVLADGRGISEAVLRRVSR